MLTLSNITHNIEGRNLFSKLNLQLDAGQKAALIGRNGSGKSTLFKIILKDIDPDNGNMYLNAKSKVTTIAQEVPDSDSTPIQYLIDSDLELRDLLYRSENTPDPNELGDIYERLIAIDAYSAESRANIILIGLGFSEGMLARPINSFSGGFKMRIALAAALFNKPDLLLLDEPTNHLDLESIIWLEEYLKTYPASVIVISHEREFLNKIVDHVFHLKNNIITKYKGNYDQFEDKYQQKLANDIAMNKKIEAQKAHMQKFVDRFRYKASKAKQAQSRLKALGKLNPIMIMADEGVVSLTFPEIEELPSPIISYDKINLGYGSNVILRSLGGTINNDDRIAILGANGKGKSTFCKMLAGELKPLNGKMEISNKLRIGYFNQHQYEILDLSKTPLEYLKSIMSLQNEFQIRTHLGCFGFSRDRVNTEIGKLSGGEKARLVFSIITLSKPHILILDEPTNHLDADMRHSLIMALNQYSGAIILISHDMHFIEHVADRLLIVAEGTIKNFDGSIRDYKKKLQENK